MRPDLRCEDARVEISARLDGEVEPSAAAALDSHLHTCRECRAYERDLDRARAALRVREAEDVPDLTGAIMERVRAEHAAGAARREWTGRLRTAVVAAAVTALILAGVTSPWRDQGPAGAARAADVVDAVRRAARDLRTYTATLRIVEHNWHPQVPVRTMRARIWFDAPERFRLRLRDLTAYPDPAGWPRNDVDVIAGPRRWANREPSSCPVQALPGCYSEASRLERAVGRRQPFDGTTTLPTDIVVPLETLASSSGFSVAAPDSVAGRRAHRIELDYREALPLVSSLQAGGMWREFHPSDEVDLWLDAATWFPLRFVVRAGDSADRKTWADARDLADRTGEVLLEVEARDFSEPKAVEPSLFEVGISGEAHDGGFSPGRFARLSEGVAPTYTAGLQPYRAGTTGKRVVLSYTDGMTWLNVSRSPGGPEAARGAVDLATAEEVRIGDGYGYYRPAGPALRRQVDLYSPEGRFHLESNLPSRELLEVAGSLGAEGRRLPPVRRRGGLSIRRLTGPGDDSSLPSFARRPTVLPNGYETGEPSAGLVYRSRPGRQTVVLYYRRDEVEYDGFGIRVTQSRMRHLPPSSESFLAPLHVDGNNARWAAGRGELDWIDDGVYRAVTAPSFDLETVLRIARNLS